MRRLQKTPTGGSASTSSTDLAALPPCLRDGGPLPQLIVFDLDYTLWPFWIDCEPALKPASKHTAVNELGEIHAFYKEVPSVLRALPLAGIRIGVASRTTTPNRARDLLKLLHIPVDADDASASATTTTTTTATASSTSSGGGSGKLRRAWDVFDAGHEMYPTTKKRHFEAIHKRTSVPYAETLFFDDERRNKDVEALGVTMYLVDAGVSWEVLEKGIALWRRRRGHSEVTPTSPGSDDFPTYG